VQNTKTTISKLLVWLIITPLKLNLKLSNSESAYWRACTMTVTQSRPVDAPLILVLKIQANALRTFYFPIAVKTSEPPPPKLRFQDSICLDKSETLS